MGLFDSYRDDSERIAARLRDIVDGDGPPERSDVMLVMRGRRGGRSVRVELNEMHGVFGVACAMRSLPIGRLTIWDERSMFASGPPVAERLRCDAGRYDGVGYWYRLPIAERDAIVELLARESSDLALRDEELCLTVGLPATLREPAIETRILATLDRLLELAPQIEAHWDVDPKTVGVGTSVHIATPSSASAPGPRVTPHDPAAVAAAAVTAREAKHADVAHSIIEAFPAVDAVRGDRDAVAGKVVILELPPVAEWRGDLSERDGVVGDDASGRYIIKRREPGMARILRAAERYELATGTSLAGARCELVARITGLPEMVVLANGETMDAKYGLALEALGAMIGDRVFIDAAAVDGDETRFAGER